MSRFETYVYYTALQLLRYVTRFKFSHGCIPALYLLCRWHQNNIVYVSRTTNYYQKTGKFFTNPLTVVAVFFACDFVYHNISVWRLQSDCIQYVFEVAYLNHPLGHNVDWLIKIIFQIPNQNLFTILLYVCILLQWRILGGRGVSSMYGHPDLKKKF